MLNDAVVTGLSDGCQFGAGHAQTSFAQDGLWFLDKLIPNLPAYNVYRAYRVSGHLDLAALSSAWRALVARHEILRTTLVEIDGRPVQRIAADGGEISLLPTASGRRHVGEDWAERMCVDEAARPFNLEKGPLARLAVASISSTEHVLVFVLHQVVADDASFSLIVAEISELYASAIGGRSPAVPSLPYQYADYARAQREQGLAPDHLEWWTSALDPLPAPPVLPTYRSHTHEPCFRGGIVRFDWGDGIRNALWTLAETEGIVPRVVLLAGLQALLHRYGAQDRVAVGVPVSVRPQDADALIGPFLNSLVLCADFSSSPTFRELLAQVARFAQEALDRRHVPFTHVVRALRPERDPRRHPLCDVFLVVHDEAESTLTLPGAVVRRLPIHNGWVPVDLTLTVETAGPSVTGSLAYRSSLFEPDMARLMVHQLRVLLAAAVADPDLPVACLPLEEPERARAAVREGDAIGAGAPVRAPVHALVRAQAERRPDAIAIAWKDGDLSYRELVEQAGRIAGRLRFEDVAGRAVVVRMPPGPRQYAALLGVLEAGAHVLWLGMGDTGERGKAVLADIRPVCMLLDGTTDGDGLAEWYRDELGGRIVDLSDAETAAIAPYVQSQRPDMLGEWAYVAYTSGSTGRPKGIPQTHGALAQFTTWMAGEFGIGPGTRVAQWVAPEHDPALCEVFATLVAGGTLCPLPERTRLHPEKLACWLAEERVSLIQTVPSFARELLGAITSQGLGNRLASLTHVLLMGEALGEDLANSLRAALPSTRLINIYGPTETVAATWHEITGTVKGTVPIGRPIPGRQVLVLDDQDRPCPPGVTGNIVIRSPYVTPGYLNADVVDAFVPLSSPEMVGGAAERCYRTGDLGRRRHDGLLEFRGRKDFQVKLFGNRVELHDIEAALAAHETVAECVAIAVKNREGLATRLVIYVVPRQSPPGTATGSAPIWRAHLRRWFGDLMLPAVFKTMDGPLPRNAAGKVDRSRLPDAGPLLNQDPRPPLTPAEKALATIWSEILGVDQISAEDTFFTVGGHSMLVPLLARRIRERMGVEISPRDCLANSLASLSAMVEAMGAGERAVGDSTEPESKPDAQTNHSSPAQRHPWAAGKARRSERVDFARDRGIG